MFQGKDEHNSHLIKSIIDNFAPNKLKSIVQTYRIKFPINRKILAA